MVDVHPLTPDTHDKLTAELAERTGRTRLEIAERIERAREMGDLSENADYHAAKDDQGWNEARVRELQAILENCEIVDVSAAGGAMAGCLAAIRFAGDDEVETYLLGGVEERRAGVELLTPASPLGQALMGKHPGEEATYETPDGRSLTVEVVKVEVP